MGVCCRTHLQKMLDRTQVEKKLGNLPSAKHLFFFAERLMRL